MANAKNHDYSDAELNNHANQMNPNNDAYWTSRDLDQRPDDWEDRIENTDGKK